SDSKLVTLIGMKNTIVIDTKNALLVANIDKAQEVKELVCELERLGKHKALVSNIFYRPWGYYEILVSAGNHQVKRVVVQPGKKISLQKHFQRAEHWVVVSGVATVTCGNKVTKITKNESTYIPVEELHRLENNEQELLELIEVQTGNYFGEDDIERFDDEYGRV
ncbi:MAG: cupin domain-containing protein, partial [Kangiellaceae bacterium]